MQGTHTLAGLAWRRSCGPSPIFPWIKILWSPPGTLGAVMQRTAVICTQGKPHRGALEHFLKRTDRALEAPPQMGPGSSNCRLQDRIHSETGLGIPCLQGLCILRTFKNETIYIFAAIKLQNVSSSPTCPLTKDSIRISKENYQFKKKIFFLMRNTENLRVRRRERQIPCAEPGGTGKHRGSASS